MSGFYLLGLQNSILIRASSLLSSSPRPTARVLYLKYSSLCNLFSSKSSKLLITSQLQKPWFFFFVNPFTNWLFLLTISNKQSIYVSAFWLIPDINLSFAISCKPPNIYYLQKLSEDMNNLNHVNNSNLVSEELPLVTIFYFTIHL